MKDYARDGAQLNLGFYLSREEPVRSCLFALRDLILGASDQIKETTKYGMPCFCYKKKIFCYLWTDKKTRHPYILFADGKLIDHPRLEAGARKRMKILRVDPAKDLAVNAIRKILGLAIKVSAGGVASKKN